MDEEIKDLLTDLVDRLDILEDSVADLGERKFLKYMLEHLDLEKLLRI